jgi:hypothetical protein
VVADATARVGGADGLRVEFLYACCLEHRHGADARRILYGWRASHIYAAHEFPVDLARLLASMLSDASDAGISRAELNAAAGGNTSAYVLEALKRRVLKVCLMSFAPARQTRSNFARPSRRRSPSA